MSEKTNISVMRSQLGRARGLGSAHAGLHHWTSERLTAIALVPLSIWFVVSVLLHLGATQPQVAAWISSPVNAALLLALIAMTFQHMQLGIQVVLEDYVDDPRLMKAMILVNKGAALILGLIAAVSVLKLALV